MPRPGDTTADPSGEAAASASGSVATTRAVIDFFKSFATPTRLDSSKHSNADSGSNNAQGAVLIGVPTPRHIARAEVSFSPLVFKDFLDRLRVDAAADLSRRMLANIKRLGDFAVFKAEEKEAQKGKAKRLGDGDKAADNDAQEDEGGLGLGFDNPYLSCFDADSTEKEVSLAFRRLVNHTLKQCLAHPLWAELEPAPLPSEDDDDHQRHHEAGRDSSSNYLVTTCETREALAECIEKLIALKCYTQLMRCFERGGQADGDGEGEDKAQERERDLDMSFDAHCEALALEYRALSTAAAASSSSSEPSSLPSSAACSSLAEAIGVPPSLLEAAFFSSSGEEEEENKKPAGASRQDEAKTTHDNDDDEAAPATPTRIGPSTVFTPSSTFAGWAMVRRELGERLIAFQAPRDKLLSLCNACRLLLGMLAASRERLALRKELEKRKRTTTTTAAAGASAGEGSSNEGLVTPIKNSADASGEGEGEEGARAAELETSAANALSPPLPLASPATAALAALPTADDLLPALVLAIIAVRPKGLLRHLRYIRCLRANNNGYGGSAGDDYEEEEDEDENNGSDGGQRRRRRGGGGVADVLRSEAGYFLTALESAAVVVAGMPLASSSSSSSTAANATANAAITTATASDPRRPAFTSIADALVPAPPAPPSSSAEDVTVIDTSATNAAALRDRKLFQAWFDERVKALPAPLAAVIVSSGSAGSGSGREEEGGAASLLFDPRDLTAEQASRLLSEYRHLLVTVKNLETLVFDAHTTQQAR